MSDAKKQLELEALAAVGEMLLFDKARGNPEEADRILRCARLFARSEDTAQRLSELCTEAGSDAAWHEKNVEELEDIEDLQAAEAVMQRRREGGEGATPVADVLASLEAGYAAQAEQEAAEFVLRIYRAPSGQWAGVLLSGGEETGRCGGCESPEDVQEAASDSGFIPDRIEICEPNKLTAETLAKSERNEDVHQAKDAGDHAQRLGISVHQGAAIAIARRGLGLSESPTVREATVPTRNGGHVSPSPYLQGIGPSMCGRTGRRSGQP